MILIKWDVLLFWFFEISDVILWFSCLDLSGVFGYVKSIENLWFMLKFHCWCVISCLLWDFDLIWWNWWCYGWMMLISWYTCSKCYRVCVVVKNSWVCSCLMRSCGCVVEFCDF